MAQQDDVLVHALNSSESDEGGSIVDLLARFLDDLETLDRQSLGLSAPVTRVSASAVSDPHPPPTNATKRKRVRISTPAHTWYQRKEELAMLRGQIGALSSQLGLLQSPFAPSRPEPHTAAPLVDAATRLQEEMRTGRIATLQNSKLRKLAEDALQMSRRMASAFAKYPLPSTAALRGVCPERRFAQVLDAPIYTELKRALDSRHLGVGPPTGVTHSADVDASVLLHHSRVVPFSLQCINNVLWLENGFAKMETLESPLKVVYKAGSMMFLEKHVRVRDATTNEAALCVLHTVFKRRVDNDRIVTAWEAIGDWPIELAGANGECARVSVREHGWATVESVATSDRCSQLSTLRASAVVFPTFTASACAHPSTSTLLKAFVDSVVPSHDSAFSARLQAFENLLLDHSLAMHC